MAEGISAYIEGQEAASVKQLNRELKQAQKGAKSFKKTTDSLATGVKNLKNTITALGITAVVKKSLEAVTEYQSSIYKLSSLMGESTKKAIDYAKSLEKVGINAAEFLGYQSKFYQSASGMGIVSDKARIMSQNLSQLAYDMASFNHEQENVAKYANKLNEAYTGSIKSLRNMGFALGEADLREEALLEGIDVNIRTLNAASKSMLRYNAIIRQSKSLQGSYINTTMSLAGAQGVLSAQFKSLYQILGSLIYPLALNIMPYIIGFVKALTNMITSIATALNIKMPVIDTSASQINMNKLEEDVEGVGKAMKESFTLGIDELNVFNKAASGASGIGGTDITSLITPESYDFLAGYEGSNAQKFFEGIQEKVEQLTPLFEGFGEAIEGFIEAIKEFSDEKLTPFLTFLGDWFGDNPEVLETIGKGLGLIAIGLLALSLIKNVPFISSLPKIFEKLNKEITSIWTVRTGSILPNWQNFALTLITVGLAALGVYASIELVKTIIDIKSGEVSGWEAFRKVVGYAALAVGAFGTAAVLAGIITIGSIASVVSVALLAFGLILTHWDEFALSVEFIVANIAKFILATIKTVIAAFVQIIMTVILIITQAIEGVAGMIIQGFEGAINGVLALARNGAKVIDDLFGSNLQSKVPDKINIKLDDNIADTMEKQRQRYMDATNKIWSDVGSSWTYEVLDTPYMESALDRYYEKTKDKDDSSLFAKLNELKELEKAYKKDDEENSKAINELLGTQVDFANSLNTNQQETKSIIEDMKNSFSTLKEDIGNIPAAEMLSDDTSELISSNEDQLDYLKFINSNTENNTKTTTTTLSAFQNKMEEALSKVQTACENIKINITNNYGGGYAGGGFPTRGEVFFARENGRPELVGQIGNRTAVMNNEQIYDGMYRTVTAALRQSSLSQPIEVTSVLELDGETVYRNQKKVEARKGFSMGGGVFAHI